jgi:histidine triad (HIT) family protein
MAYDDPSCAFCAIANGRDKEVEVVAEEPVWVAFFPLDPATPGHTLVIPRFHVRDVWALELEDGGELMAGVIEVGRAIQAALSPEGMNLISSAGRAAEQTVFHLHIHVVPRWERDGFGRIWPTDHRFRDMDLEDVADRIRSALRASWE